MKVWHLAGAAALGVTALVGGTAAQGPARAQEDVVWHSDYTAAEKLARESGKPLFVAFRCER